MILVIEFLEIKLSNHVLLKIIYKFYYEWIIFIINKLQNIDLIFYELYKPT